MATVLSFELLCFSLVFRLVLAIMEQRVQDGATVVRVQAVGVNFRDLVTWRVAKGASTKSDKPP
jgi:hypothetical protein